jgi:hypothetical protein
MFPNSRPGNTAINDRDTVSKGYCSVSEFGLQSCKHNLLLLLLSSCASIRTVMMIQHSLASNKASQTYTTRAAATTAGHMQAAFTGGPLPPVQCQNPSRMTANNALQRDRSQSLRSCTTRSRLHTSTNSHVPHFPTHPSAVLAGAPQVPHALLPHHVASSAGPPQHLLPPCMPPLLTSSHAPPASRAAAGTAPWLL